MLFRRSPVEVVPDSTGNEVAGVKLEINDVVVGKTSLILVGQCKMRREFHYSKKSSWRWSMSLNISGMAFDTWKVARLHDSRGQGDPEKASNL